MATQVTMPQLGESVVEGTVGKWLVSEGQQVNEYDPLLQVSTDKVDTEVPAPASGVVLKIYVPEGQTVTRGTLLAVIGQPGEPVSETAPSTPQAHGAPEVRDGPPAPAQAEPQPAVQPAPSPAATPVAARMAQDLRVDLGKIPGSGPGGRITKEDVQAYVGTQAAGESEPTPGQAVAAPDRGAAQLAPHKLGFISPAVARLASELDVDLNQVTGTGEGGRITKKDVQTFAEGRGAAQPAAAEVPVWEQPGTGDLFKPTAGAQVSAPAAPAATPAAAPSRPAPAVAPAGTPAEGARLPSPVEGELVPLSNIRRSIAKHMVLSRHTSAHVTTVMEADMTRVVRAREALKGDFERQGARLTFTPFFIQAIIAGLRAVPEANSTFQEDSLLLHRQVNIGMAVAIPEGLIVPVIRDAGEKSLLGLARAVNELAERARNRRLSPDDVQGGTFTLTNHGTAGSLFATPIINQPQAGILGVGMIQKRPVVVSRGHPILPDADDYIAVRPMVYLSFSFDHRILDGAGADRFLGRVKEFLESYQA